MAGRQALVARSRACSVRLEPADEEKLKAYARRAGLADARGDGVSALLREAGLRYGADAARDVAEEASSKASRGSRGSASPRRRSGPDVEAGGKNGPSPTRYRCERDCEPERRVLSPQVKCNVCSRRMTMEVHE